LAQGICILLIVAITTKRSLRAGQELSLLAMASFVRLEIILHHPELKWKELMEEIADDKAEVRDEMAELVDANSLRKIYYLRFLRPFVRILLKLSLNKLYNRNISNIRPIILAITHTSHTRTMAVHNNNDTKTQLASSKAHLTIANTTYVLI
ncbi:hypothetical protein ACJX0J_029571, partial [Zea mays]